MGYSLIEYNKLKGELELAIKVTLRGHGYTSVTELDPERRLHVEIVQKTMEILDSFPSSTNTNNNNGEAVSDNKDESVSRDLLLNAMAIHIRDVTYATYKVRSADNSGFYGQLGVALGFVDIKKGLIKEALPNPVQKQELMEALCDFVRQCVYLNGNPNQGYLDVEAQPYAAVKNFKTCDFVSELQTKVHTATIKSIQTCESGHQIGLKEKSNNYKKAEHKEKKGYFPSLSIWSGAKADTEGSHTSPQLS